MITSGVAPTIVRTYSTSPVMSVFLIAPLVGDEEEAVAVGYGIEAGDPAEAVVVRKAAEGVGGGERVPVGGEHVAIFLPQWQ